MKKSLLILVMAFAVLFTACTNEEPQTIATESTECEIDNQVVITKEKGGYSVQLCGNDTIAKYGDPYIYNDHYFFSVQGDAPGYINQIFIYNPETEDYILAQDKFWSPNRTVEAKSSNNTEGFAAVLNTEEGIGADYTIEDDAVKLTVNDKSFTKKEVLDGKVEHFEQILDCHFKSFPYEEGKEEVAELYLADFPEKVTCYDELWQENSKAVGYIDLINNEYVKF